MTPTSIGGEKQACISGGVNPPADIASGRIAEAFLNYVDSYRVSVGFLYESVNDDRVTSVNGVIDQSCLVLRKVNTAMASCP